MYKEKPFLKRIVGTVIPTDQIHPVNMTIPPQTLKRINGPKMPHRGRVILGDLNGPRYQGREIGPEQIQAVGSFQFLESLMRSRRNSACASESENLVGLSQIFTDLFRSSNGDGYYRAKDNGYFRLCNFTVHVEKCIHLIRPYDEPLEEAQLEITYDRNREIKKDHFQISIDKISTLSDFILTKFPDCWIETPEKKELSKIIAKEYSSCQCRETKYEQMQWSLPDRVGSRIFHEGTKTGIKKFPESPVTHQMLQKALSLFYVAEKPVAYSLAAFQACAFLAQLFMDAHFPLQHTLALIAPSGTGKSSLAKAMTQPFTISEKKLIPLRSTKAALKGLTASYVDDIMCLDDLAPEGSKKLQAERQESLQELIRAFCDEGGSAYKYKGDQILQPKLRGALLWTAEQAPVMIGSGEARVLRVEFSEHPNYEILGEFQNDPLILAIFWKQFIIFLEENYVTLVRSISQIAQKKRQKSSDFHHPRMKDILVHMDIASEILCTFLGKKGIMTSHDLDMLLSDMKTEFQKLVQIQDMHTEKLDPLTGFLEAIFSLYSSGKLSVADTPEKYRSRSSICYGYMDGENLMMLDPIATYGLVEAYFQKGKQSYPLTATKTWELLRENGLLQVTENRGYKRRASVKADPNRTRFVCLKRSECITYLEKKGEEHVF